MYEQVDQSAVQEAIRQLNSVRRSWLRRPGVTAVDVGFKIRNGEVTNAIALRVHVARKLPPQALPEYEVFTISGETPREVGGFPIDVIEATYGPSQLLAEPQDIEAVDRKSAVEPLVGGISVGNPRITAGTLAAIVFDRVNCSMAILSNWHVLVGSPSAVVGEPIYQPGKFDGGTASDTVATLTRFQLDADMDAALARLNGARTATRDIIGLNPIPGVDMPALGMNLKKSGRTTAVTEGMIDGLSLSATITYDHGPNTFHDQIHIVPRPPWPSVDYETSKGGDSGSVWVNEANGRAVALHFAGETDPAPTSEHAIGNPMHKVVTALNFSFTPLVCLVTPKVVKVVLDAHKPVFQDLPKKLLDPPKGLLDPPKSLLDPIKRGGFDQRIPVFPGGGPVAGVPGQPAPFVLSTPHHFGGGAQGGRGEVETAIAQLDALLEQYQALRDAYVTSLGDLE